MRARLDHLKNKTQKIASLSGVIYIASPFLLSTPIKITVDIYLTTLLCSRDFFKNPTWCIIVKGRVEPVPAALLIIPEKKQADRPEPSKGVS